MTRTTSRFAVVAAFAISMTLLLGCEEPPPLPDTSNIDDKLQRNLEQTRDAASSGVESITDQNQKARKRLAPDSGRDASQ